MKKFLALVLALIMTMSLVTISAGAADFTDADVITYDEAVGVISGLNIVGGYADGSFKPGNTLTRGAAAKIICNMILGPTTAAELPTAVAPYPDVPAGSTYNAQFVIQTCQDNWVIFLQLDVEIFDFCGLNSIVVIQVLPIINLVFILNFILG